MSAVADEIQKPPYGSPCNGCGQCCMDRVCPLGSWVFERRIGPCPALTKIGRQWACGLVLNPRLHAPTRTARYGAAAMVDAALALTGAGSGCDALLVNEPDSPEAQLRMLEAAMAIPEEQIDKARKLWGIRNA